MNQLGAAVARDVNKATGPMAMAKVPFPNVKAKACQLNPKDRPRPQLPIISVAQENLMQIQIRENIIYINIS